MSLNYLVLGVNMIVACINCPESFVKAGVGENLCVSKNECGEDEIALVDKEKVFFSCRRCLGDYELKTGADGEKFC